MLEEDRKPYVHECFGRFFRTVLKKLVEKYDQFVITVDDYKASHRASTHENNFAVTKWQLVGERGKESNNFVGIIFATHKPKHKQHKTKKIYKTVHRKIFF